MTYPQTGDVWEYKTPNQCSNYLIMEIVDEVYFDYMLMELDTGVVFEYSFRFLRDTSGWSKIA